MAFGAVRKVRRATGEATTRLMMFAGSTKAAGDIKVVEGSWMKEGSKNENVLDLVLQAFKSQDIAKRKLDAM